MFEVTKYPNATFSWADVATTDTAAGKAFYMALFGWEADDRPVGEGVYYTMFSKDGKHVAALSPMPPGPPGQDVPPYWTSYISVDDLEGTVARVSELGGTVLMPPFDVMEEGRMALIQDPTGGVVALWQAKNHIGARLVNTVGAMSWNELATRDAEQAAAFYGGLLGWEVRIDEASGYRTILNGERMAGGMIQMTEEWGEMPSHWMVYFSVADCQAAVAKVQELGGQVIMPPTEAAGVGEFAVVRDPQGAVFTVIHLLNPDPAPVAE